jgi:glucose/arabinose dehydrogenase
VYSEWRAAGPESADLKSERIVLEVPQPFDDHKAGQLRFGRDEFLYIALGDGGHGNDPLNNAQNTASLLGKILRIDVDHRATVTNAGVRTTLGYAIPPDNPFVGEPDLYEYGVRKEIWAYGLRNPCGLAWTARRAKCGPPMWARTNGRN